MIRKLFVAACLAVPSLYCNGQTETVKPKIFNHYLGFQANELMRQLFSFNNNNTAVTNPYLLVYTITRAEKNYGLHFGFGYTYTKELTKQEPASRETKSTHLSYRIGIEKKFIIGKRFEGGVALDYTNTYILDKTFNIVVTNNGSQVDSSTSTITTKTTAPGFGPQFSLAYHITDKIMLGTEASMYYSLQTQKENLLIENKITDLFSTDVTISTSNFNSENDITSFSFTIPVALFLIVKF